MNLSMKYLTRSILIIGFTVLNIAIAFGQRTRPSATQPKPSPTPRLEKEQDQPTTRRQVTINLKTGAPVTGQFIQADASVVQIEVAGNLLKIKLDDVVSVVFAPEFLPKQLATPEPSKDEDANRALRSLRKLAGATVIGINFQEYGSRLIDVKNEVDEAISRMQSGDLKTELILAMEAYVDAGQAWNQMLRYDFMLPNAEPGLTLIRKYSLQPTELVPGNRNTLALPRNYVLSTLWAAARVHIDRANSLLASPHLPANTTPSEVANASTTGETSAKPVNIVGTWLVTLTVGSQSSKTRFLITSTGNRLTGQFMSAYGITPVNRIDRTGNTINASFQDVIDRQQVTIDLLATIDGDQMSGTARITAANGQSVTVPISGIRQ
jgi:hypothetical protein